jgi:hypothetical protein
MPGGSLGGFQRQCRLRGLDLALRKVHELHGQQVREISPVEIVICVSEGAEVCPTLGRRLKALLGDSLALLLELRQRPSHGIVLLLKVPISNLQRRYLALSRVEAHLRDISLLSFEIIALVFSELGIFTRSQRVGNDRLPNILIRDLIVQLVQHLERRGLHCGSIRSYLAECRLVPPLHQR